MYQSQAQELDPTRVGSPAGASSASALQWLAPEPQVQAAMLDSVFAASPCRIFVTDQEGRFIYVSLLGAQVAGLERSAMLGKTWRELGLPADGMEPLDPLRQRAFEEGQPSTGEIRFRSGEGLIDYQYVIRPVRLDGEIVAVNTCLQDITERKRLQEQREDILRAVSHDLRNPLAAMQVQAQLLQRLLGQAGRPEQELRIVEGLAGSVRRMNTMIQDLVDAARSESGQLALRREPLDMASFLRSLKERLAPALEMDRIQIEADQGLPRVDADPSRLERIVTNLISNALKYSEPGTPVIVRLNQHDGELITSVTDRGPGIPSEDLPHLFERYFRSTGAAGSREGLGLGLYITKMLVEAHRGRIWVESEPGRGSTFSFSLPLP